MLYLNKKYFSYFSYFKRYALTVFTKKKYADELVQQFALNLIHNNIKLVILKTND